MVLTGLGQGLRGRGGGTVIVFLMALFLLIGGLPSNLPTPGKIVGLFKEIIQPTHTLQIIANNRYKNIFEH